MKRRSKFTQLFVLRFVSSFIIGLTAAGGAGQLAFAEPTKPQDGPIVVHLEEAVELALMNNFALRRARIADKDAQAQVSQEWARVWPSVDGTATYTRNITAPNPFAGSGAGGVFSGFDAIGWLAFNEDQRQDGDPETNGISFGEFQQRSAAGLANAGVVVDPDANPFLVENQINLGLVVRQVLYDGAVFAGLRGTDILEETAKVGVDVEAHKTVQDTSAAFYGALLAARQTEILKKSVSRTQTTVDETKKRVDQGVVPRFQLLTAEVELANLQTELARAENAAARSIDDLRLILGLPAGPALEVRGELTLDGVGADLPQPSEALEVAMQNRPDLKQARLAVEGGEVQEDATWGEFMPKLNAVANISLAGSIPDDRSFTVSADNGDPFAVRVDENGVFSDAFWFSSISVGLSLEWNIFDGFETWNRLKRDRLATERARVDLEQARTVITLEVQQSVRELNTARQQIATQERNRQRAELNYDHAQVRVREGVSNQFELRQASEQLDESRFNYLQAVHDFLVARVAYLVAIGTPPILGAKAK